MLTNKAESGRCVEGRQRSAYVILLTHRRFVLEDSHALLVPALGRPMRDGCHLSTPGYQSLGEEVARALLRHRYGLTNLNWPGPVMDAAVAGPDGKTVVAHFAEAQELDGAEAADFTVLAGTNRVQCVKLEPGRTVVRLTLERQVELPARLLYGGRVFPGSALKDEAGNHAPSVLLDIQDGPAPVDRPTAAPNGAGI